MKTKILGIILILIGILLVVFSMIKQSKKENRPYKKQDFPETVEITNNTDYTRLDTLVMVMTNKFFKLDTFSLIINYIPKSVNDGKGKDEFVLQCLVQQIPFGVNKFLMLIERDLPSYKAKTALEHEMQHVFQMVSGRLIIYGKIGIWEGDTIDMREVNYMDRPWEKEAYKLEGEVLKQIEQYLY